MTQHNPCGDIAVSSCCSFVLAWPVATAGPASLPLPLFFHAPCALFGHKPSSRLLLRGITVNESVAVQCEGGVPSVRVRGCVLFLWDFFFFLAALLALRRSGDWCGVGVDELGAACSSKACLRL